MNKKLLIFGLIVIIGTGFYMNNLFNNDNFEVTQFGTVFDVPAVDLDFVSDDNGTEIFKYEQGDHSYYVIDFNYKENPELYEQLCNAICKGKKYEQNGVVFYEQTSQVLGNNFNVWTGVNLAIKDHTIAGSFVKNDTTGEVIFCISTSSNFVVDTLEDVDWGDKASITANTSDDNATTTLLSSSDDSSVSKDTTPETNSNDLYESQFNQKDGEPKGETLNEGYIESTGASNDKELQKYMESHVPDDYK